MTFGRDERGWEEEGERKQEERQKGKEGRRKDERRREGRWGRKPVGHLQSI